MKDLITDDATVAPNTTEVAPDMTEFETFGFSKTIVNSIMKMGFEDPTPIQRKAIPHVLKGQDLVGLAQTGTGKTAAFGLPLVQHLLDNGHKPEPKTVHALVLAPTRELVNQIADNLRKFVRNTPLKVNTVVGGASINNQIRQLSRGTDILVATPGRLIDLLDRRALTISTAKFLVLDEADQMLDMGFIHALNKIAPQLGTPRQTLLFSATMPKSIAELAKTYLTNPVRVEAAPPGKPADKVRQSVHFVGARPKLELLKESLAANPQALSLVFSRTKHGAEKLMKMLVASGFAAASIHGNKSQNQRDRALAAFRSGETRVLVATDVAARGIDVPGVTHVYNFDLPEVPENYVHRIGRTARAGADGEAIAYCDGTDVHMLADIERVLGREVPVASGTRPAEDPDARRGKRRGGRGGGGGQGHGQRRGGNGGGNKPKQARPEGASKPGRPNRRRRPAKAARG